MSDTVKLLGHANWNLFAIVTIGQFAAFVIASLDPGQKALGMFAGALALAVAGDLVFLGLTDHPSALEFPGLYANALVGTAGVIGSSRSESG